MPGDWIKENEQRNRSSQEKIGLFSEILFDKFKVTVDVPAKLMLFANHMHGLNNKEDNIDLKVFEYLKSNDKAEFVNYMNKFPLSMDDMRQITYGEKLVVPDGFLPKRDEKILYTAEQIPKLQALVKSSGDICGFEGEIAVKRPGIVSPDVCSTDSEHADKYYNIASVGKVLTGTLLLKCMAEGEIDCDLDKPFPDDFIDSIVKSFPTSKQDEMKERLKATTIHQVMTHHAGFGDFNHHPDERIETYFKALASGKLFDDPKQLLQFAGRGINDLSPIGEHRYSNVGILLVGLFVQHEFNKKHGTELGYHEILTQNLADPAGIKIIDKMPESSCCNPLDTVSPKLLGNPAGGYWMKAADLAKFAEFLQEKFTGNEIFRSLLENYGHEFYNKDSKILAHHGDTDLISTTFFASMETGGAFVAFAAKGNGVSPKLYNICSERVAADQEKPSLSIKEPEITRKSSSGDLREVLKKGFSTEPEKPLIDGIRKPSRPKF